MINPVDPTIPIIEENGIMQDPFAIFIQQVGELGILSGAGSPEGIVTADPLKLYMDITGTAGNILYIKRDSDIGGDRSQGWILV